MQPDRRSALQQGRFRIPRFDTQLNGFTSTKNEEIREPPQTWDALAALKI